MTSFVSSITDRIFALPKSKILIMGLDSSGKTTILYRLILNEIVTTIPTIGCNVESYQYKHHQLTFWDIGTSSKTRMLRRHYFDNTPVLIFVIDSNDKERLTDEYCYGTLTVKDELQELLSYDELRNTALLIFANKNDLPNALSVNEIRDKLSLNQLKDRQWHIVGCSATSKTLDGIYEGLDWMINYLDTLHSSSSTSLSAKYLQYKFQKEWQSRKQKETEKRLQKQLEAKIIRNGILIISGYVRDVVYNHKLMSFVSLEVCKLIHLYYEENDCFDKRIKYYGENELNEMENEMENDINLTQIADKSILLEYLDRIDAYKYYIIDEDEFLTKYENKIHNDSKWIHYDFMRMIWICFKQNGWKNGLKMILKLSEFNMTKTIFWSQIIYYGMSMDSLSQKNFHSFLVANPRFANNYDVLMDEYYSTSLLNIIDCKEKNNEMILPDIQPLPSIIKKHACINKLNNKNVYLMNKIKKDNDDAFLLKFENRTYTQWEGHISFIRIIFCYFQKFGSTHTAIKKIRTEWKQFVGLENDHETKMFFWIHMVRYYYILYLKFDTTGKRKQFNLFLLFCDEKMYNGLQCQLSNSEWWKEFYSDKQIQQKKAWNQLVLSDIKPLPQLLLVQK